MALSHVGAIYATKSLMLQRIYIPHYSDIEIDEQHVGPGESVLKIPIEVYRKGGAQACQDVIGEPAPTVGTCHLIHKDTGEILDTFHGDPELLKNWPGGHRVVLAPSEE